jgi:membrane protease subunit HflK
MSWDWDKLKEQQNAKRPQRGNVAPPNLDEFFEKFRGANSLQILLIVAGVLVLFFASSIFYTVKPYEEAVVQRFGAYVRTNGPGLHMKLPFPFEVKTKVNVLKIETLTFEGMPEAESARRIGVDVGIGEVSLMLTGDLNVAVVPWVVQYRVADSKAYLFNVANVLNTLSDLSEASMRQVVGDRSVDEVLSRRDEVEMEAQKLLQKELDAASTGFLVQKVALKTVNVPVPVQPSFNEVNQSKQEKQQLIYQAREDYNRAVPQAIGEGERIVREAEGYELERVNRAKGDTARFLAVYDEYSKAREVTRKRMYLEAMRETLPKMGRKFILDADQDNVLPFLNLQSQEMIKP